MSADSPAAKGPAADCPQKNQGLANVSINPIVRKTRQRMRTITADNDIEPHLVSLARIYLLQSQEREKFFPKTIFRDLGWNMLLDLFVQEHDGNLVSIKSACIASRGPLTSALRSLHSMANSGLVERFSDNNDGRRIFVSLSNKAREAVKSWLESCASLPDQE